MSQEQADESMAVESSPLPTIQTPTSVQGSDIAISQPSQGKSRKKQQNLKGASANASVIPNRKDTSNCTGVQPAKKVTATSPSSSSSSSTIVVVPPLPRKDKVDKQPKRVEPDDDNIGPVPPGLKASKLFVYEPNNSLKIPWIDLYKLPVDERKSIAPPKDRRNNAFTCCLKCGYWLVNSHTSCTRKTKLGDYVFVPPPQLLERGQELDNTSDPNFKGPNFISPDKWDLSYFAHIPPHLMFSSPATIHCIPEDARAYFSNLVRDVTIQALAARPGALEALLVLPRIIVPSSIKGKIEISRIYLNVAAFRSGKFQALWEKPNIVLRYNTFDPTIKAEALTLAGEPSAALDALISEGALDPRDCYEELKALHPAHPVPTISDVPTSPPVESRDMPFFSADFKTAITNLRRRKAADALGWRGDFIKQLNRDAVKPLTRLCKIIATTPAFIPDPIKPFFFGARLIPIPKKNKKVRPIAIGSIFHKLISSAIMNHISKDLQSTFAPVQFGVGIKGGAENIVHGIRNKLSDDPNLTLVSLDLENAFNNVNRQVFLNEVKSKFPNILCWIHQVYGAHSWLLPRGCEPILSAAGVRQGDPLGPFLFALAIQPTLLEVSKWVTSITYMDDIYLIGNHDSLIKAMKLLHVNFSNPCHLRINIDKSWSTKPIKDSGLMVETNPFVMKVPLDPDFQIKTLNEKTLKRIQAVPKIKNTQVALLLLRQINNGSLTYTLRTCIPNATNEITQIFTKKIIEALAKILECSTHDINKVKDRVFLPLGPGLGFTPTSDLAKPAFFASFLQATTLLNSSSETAFPIPKHPKSGSREMKEGTLYQRTISGAFKHIELTKDPSLKLQHLLTESLNSKRFKDVRDRLDNVNKKSSTLPLANMLEPGFLLSPLRLISPCQVKI